MSATCRPLLLLVVLVPLAAACEAMPAERPSSPAADAGTHWKVLGTWSGSGDRQTESFDVTSGSLRLVWEASGGSAGERHLRVALHSSISGRVIETIVEASGAGTDTVHLAAEPRVAYLLIESEGVGWRLTLEEGVREAGTGP